MRSFLETLQERVLVCDGAMGTMLYTKGVFINRCFDELNVSDPDLVCDVHLEYVRAGADVVETNTFGANRYKLIMHGLERRVREINLAGAHIGRSAAGAGVYVAGAIGPLGIRIEPWGKTGIDEARLAFREQVQALVDGGVDLLILETFSDMNEIHAAMLGVRDVTNKPIVAQMTIEEDGNSLEGTPPEVFGKKLDDWGADIVGLNCSVGPQAMLDSIERIAQVTPKKLSVQPNAGKPKNVEGRNIYLCLPEYMASYARKFVRHGVRLVGGCCGTTPEHMRAICRAVKGLGVPSARPAPASTAHPATASVRAVPRDKKSGLARKLSRHEFVRLVEMIPPQGHNYVSSLEKARQLKEKGVDAVSIPDGPRASARMSALSLAVLIETLGIETCVHYTCGDHNLLGMQADLLGAYALGLRNLLLATGDPSGVGNDPNVTAVFDVDSIGLTNMVSRLNRGIDVGGKSIGAPTGFLIGVLANPAAINPNEELKRFDYKVEAGAEFAITRPVFDPAVLERFVRRVEHYRIPLVAGIIPLISYETAEYMNNEVPGCSVPASTLGRLRRTLTGDAARDEGIRIAQEVLADIRDMVQGVQISTPPENHQCVFEILSGINKGVTS